MKRYRIVVLATLMLPAEACAADYTAALARGNHVQLLTTAGKTINVRENYLIRDARIAPDGMAAAWLLLDVAADERLSEHGASTLVIYTGGGRRTLVCSQLIREYWFHAQGREIAYDCGGRHFAGNEVLFDTRTLTEKARFHQAEIPIGRRPAWSSSAQFVPEN